MNGFRLLVVLIAFHLSAFSQMDFAAVKQKCKVLPLPYKTAEILPELDWETGEVDLKEHKYVGNEITDLYAESLGLMSDYERYYSIGYLDNKNSFVLVYLFQESSMITGDMVFSIRLDTFLKNGDYVTSETMAVTSIDTEDVYDENDNIITIHEEILEISGTVLMENGKIIIAKKESFIVSEADTTVEDSEFVTLSEDISDYRLTILEDGTIVE